MSSQSRNDGQLRFAVFAPRPESNLRARMIHVWSRPNQHRLAVQADELNIQHTRAKRHDVSRSEGHYSHGTGTLLSPCVCSGAIPSSGWAGMNTRERGRREGEGRKREGKKQQRRMSLFHIQKRRLRRCAPVSSDCGILPRRDAQSR